MTVLALPAAVACVTPSLPPAPPASDVAEQAYVRAQSLYLRPERLDERVLSGALEALEGRFDPVRFDQNGTRGDLRVGKERVQIPTQHEPTAEGFLGTLAGSLEFVRLHLGAEQIEEELGEDEDLELLALRGALGSLDRYSTIFSGKGTEDFQIRFSGQLQGIGSRIGRRDGDLVAVRVFPESPASRAGLQDGDAIVEIDGQPTRPMTVSEAVTKIRGPADSIVVLTARREDEILEIPIKRGKVTVPTVETESLSDGIGYARIFQMSRSTPSEFKQKVSSLGKLEGLVLDLRANSGGSMLAAARLADLFLDDGVIVRTVGRSGEPVSGLRDRATATTKVTYPFPIVVLVDSHTASAAEIVSGAIAPLERVTLVGQTTFGKGVVQRIYRLPENNLLKLTVAEYMLSGDRKIHKEGVEPDLVLFPVSTERVAPLANRPDEALPYLRTAGEDDRFPIEVAEAILRDGFDAAVEGVRGTAAASIQERLGELGVEWAAEATELGADLEPLEIELDMPLLDAGSAATGRITVRNPNPFPIPDAWATITGPIAGLSEKAFPIGTLPADGEVAVDVEVKVTDGLSAGELPVQVHVASRLRAITSQRQVLRVEEHVPDLEIEVVRDGDLAKVTLRNRGDREAGDLRVDVPGAFQILEELPAGSEEVVELALAGTVKQISVTLLGPMVSRRVSIPLPETSVTVVPPEIRILRGGFPGFPRVRVEASDPGGLREGWVSLDGQKRAYAEWTGRDSASLAVGFSEEEHDVAAKVETETGISVIDRRVLTRD
jgi:carboxyl-terminal processing protease